MVGFSFSRLQGTRYFQSFTFCFYFLVSLSQETINLARLVVVEYLVCLFRLFWFEFLEWQVLYTWIMLGLLCTLSCRWRQSSKISPLMFMEILVSYLSLSVTIGIIWVVLGFDGLTLISWNEGWIRRSWYGLEGLECFF